PWPTLRPGNTTVPRWRTRMLPASTRSPPNFFTPSRFAFESRPFLVEDWPFLCAMAGLPLDGRHADARELVAIAATAAILAPALELEDLHLDAAAVLDDLGRDRGAFPGGAAHRDLVAVADQQHVVELETRARLAGQARDVQDLVGRDLGLNAGDVHDRVHVNARFPRVAGLRPGVFLDRFRARRGTRHGR